MLDVFVIFIYIGLLVFVIAAALFTEELAMSKTMSGLPSSMLPSVEHVALTEWQKHAQKGAAYEDQGEDMKWAACESYRAANEAGATQQQIADEAGKSQSHISFMLKALISKLINPVEGWTFANYYADAMGRQPHNTQSNSNEWYTPAPYIASVRRVLGVINLDPASCEQANATVGAETFFTQDDDGLAQAWFGKVFMNPPWGSEGPAFSARLVEEYERGKVTEAIALVNAHSTETNWFAPYFDHVLCFTDARIDYNSPTAKATTSTHGSVFAYLGPASDKFADEFAKWGAVVKRWP